MSPTTITRAAFDGDEVDLLIIGGGITGAALAHEAASRGLSVALVEQRDFGGATSAATGKLVHGGLRYLKKLELGLVRESLAERRNLMRIAPNLVAPIPIVLPEPGVVEHLGLTAYDLLSIDRNRGVRPSKRIGAHRRLSKTELSRFGLDHLRSGMLYHDAMMVSPERLTLAFVRSAVARGAKVANYTRLDRFLTNGNRVVGGEVTDLATGATGGILASLTVNATGSWAHDVLAASPLTAGIAGPVPRVRSEGIYLVTRQVTEVMVLTVSAHGHFSFAPWRGHSLVGPTETPYTGPVEEWRVTRSAIEALVASVAGHNTARAGLTMDDVVAAYGGLRPLTEAGAVDTYTASRASEVVDHLRDGVDGLVSATGGKYTTSRAFAAQVVNRVAKRIPRAVRPSATDSTPLDACALAAEPADLLEQLYGTDAAAVRALAAADPSLARELTQDGELLAGAVWAARHEAVVHLTDVLLRRTGVGQLGDPGEDALAAVAAVVATELGWDQRRTTAELEAARAAVRLPQE